MARNSRPRCSSTVSGKALWRRAHAVHLGDISAAEAGSASGVLTTVQQIASALGVALLGVVLLGALERGLSQT